MKSYDQSRASVEHSNTITLTELKAKIVALSDLVQTKDFKMQTIPGFVEDSKTLRDQAAEVRTDAAKNIFRTEPVDEV